MTLRRFKFRRALTCKHWCADYENLIVGAPTWNTGADEDRSGTSWDEISSDEIGGLSGKKVACFGLGDAMSYGEHFCDAMGELHDKFKTAGATMVGMLPCHAVLYIE